MNERTSEREKKKDGTIWVWSYYLTMSDACHIAGASLKHPTLGSPTILLPIAVEKHNSFAFCLKVTLLLGIGVTFLSYCPQFFAALFPLCDSRCWPIERLACIFFRSFAFVLGIGRFIVPSTSLHIPRAVFPRKVYTFTLALVGVCEIITKLFWSCLLTMTRFIILLGKNCCQEAVHVPRDLHGTKLKLSLKN